MFTILIVEDDTAIRDMLAMFLSTNNYKVETAEDGKQGLDILHKTTPDLLLLDWMLPDMAGVDLIPQIRKLSVHKELPILMLTARAEEADKIKGLNMGADDYMTKPVSLQELDARIRALIRRAQGLNQQKLLIQGTITLDPENNDVEINGEKIKIGGMEYRLLHFFMKNPDRLYTRAQLLDSVWGQTVYVEERTVDVHIMRLRKILKSYSADFMLKTIRGMGYRFGSK
jgi:two-component system phosphate regulon response regulator PhoB